MYDVGKPCCGQMPKSYGGGKDSLVRLREMGKPFLGLSVNVDKMCRKAP